MRFSPLGTVARLKQLGGARGLLLLRAAVWLTIASAAVARLPFRSAIRLGCARLPDKKLGSIEDAVWAVEAAAQRLPLRTLCIEKGIAVQRLLRTGGVDAILEYGARLQSQTGDLEAHVWVTVDGRAIMGGPEAAGFARLATYP